MDPIANKKTRRQEALLEVLRTKKRMDTKEVVKLLHISESTARRFFDELENKGVIIRAYGGIKLSPEWDAEYLFDDLQYKQTEQKKRIGKYACSFVQSDDVIFIDAGTTLQHMAAALVHKIEAGELRDIQIFTNSLINLKVLENYSIVHLIGGTYRKKRQDFCGHLAENMLESISFQKCFLGADGIGIDTGIMATDAYTARSNQIVAERAGQMYLLADSTKFMRRSFMQYAAIDEAQTVITDTDLSDDIFELFLQHGVNIKRV